MNVDAMSDEAVFEALGKRLERLLPDRRSATDAFVAALQRLPLGLRSMAATYELDVSMSLDDLGWHFGNWHHKGLAEETLKGLEELGASELASTFKAAFAHAEQYWKELGEDGWSDWYSESPLDRALAPLNEEAWALLDKQKMGLFSYWVEYARRRPGILVEE